MSEQMIVCRHCGTEIEEVKIRAPRTKSEEAGKDLEGRIVLLSDGYMNKAEQTELYRNLLRTAYRQGKALGWAYHQFRNRTGLNEPPRGKAKGAILGDNPSYAEVECFVQYLRKQGQNGQQIDWAVNKECSVTWSEIQREKRLTATRNNV
jgi:hypothetical protein